ncbi:hypothetical protein CF327_g4882 [Tilletia walkeri]|uniref:Uncharacterized protein n=1 Tax=Tilletia walkeri TaxID=117179 RepID=A0A8X7T505_9BASI|nr:hypothetical protein CF327_g4882 [Tilletia walkeri]KAE8268679.1 hypothetical protein A4X09_0g3662 [Tilletia walkeri]
MDFDNPGFQEFADASGGTSWKSGCDRGARIDLAGGNLGLPVCRPPKGSGIRARRETRCPLRSSRSEQPEREQATSVELGSPHRLDGGYHLYVEYGTVP